LLKGQIAEFSKFRGQNERIHCCRNVAIAGGTAVFVFSISIQQAKDMQWSRSNRGPRLSSTFSSGKITVLQRQDWLKEVAGESIKGGRKPRRGGKKTELKNQPRKTELRTKKKAEKTEHKSKYRKKERTSGQHTMRRIILEIIFGPANKEKTRIQPKNTHSKPESSL